MVKADYKQVQMRLLANLTDDPELVSVFRQGLDAHWITVEMCGIQDAHYNERRNKAKAINFGILFQMTSDGLSRELGTDRRTAQRYINAFWEKYSTAKKWLDDFVEELKDKPSGDRVVRSSPGRTRRFDGEFGLRERRIAIHHQSTGQGSLTEDCLRYFRQTVLDELKYTEVRCRKPPNISLSCRQFAARSPLRVSPAPHEFLLFGSLLFFIGFLEEGVEDPKKTYFSLRSW